MNVKINGENFDFFSGFSLTRKYDSVGSTFTFEALFEPESESHKRLFKPFSFQTFEAWIDGKKILTGTILNTTFGDSDVKELVKISGYSKTGVLESCSPSKESYPLSYSNIGLLDIAKKLCAPFGIDVVAELSSNTRITGTEQFSEESFQNAVNAVYDQVDIDDDKTIKASLTELAKDRGVVLSHDTNGNLLLTLANTFDSPTANLGEGTPGIKLGASYKGQNMFSNLLVVQDVNPESENIGEEEISNPYVTNVVRTKTYTQKSGDDNDTQNKARRELSKQLKNLGWSIESDSIYWNNGRLIEPNQIVALESELLYLFKKTRLFVESVTYKGDAEKETASVKLVLPEVYNNEIVNNIFE